MNTSEKLCPSCNNKNEGSVSVCKHCGAQLDEHSTAYVAIPEPSVSAPAWQTESTIDVESIPEEGIAIQIAGESKPLYVPISKEIIIGRVKEETPASEAEKILDLTYLSAASLGVSRQHVMIKQTASGYEVTDLGSTNGSWLNAERLVPNKPYQLASGSHLRIGNMRLLIMYRPA